MQDNDPKHTAKLTKEWLHLRNVNVLEWPAQSPDLNPIENLWKMLKIQVHNRNPRSLEELKTFCHEEWAQINPMICRKLTDGYKARLKAVLANGGFGTKY